MFYELYNVSRMWHKLKNGAKFTITAFICLLIFGFLLLFLHIFIMSSGRSDISCLSSLCSDDVINDNGVATRYLKAGCCALSVFGECYKGVGSQDNCIIPEHKGNVTIRSCHRMLCTGYEGCCARIMANDQCAKGRYTIAGCSVDVNRHIFPEGYGGGSPCRADIECAIKLTVHPLLSMCTRCINNVCQVGPYDKDGKECKLMRPQTSPDSSSQMISRLIYWANWYRNYNDAGSIPKDEKYLYNQDKKKVVLYGWKQWLDESIQK